VTNKTTVYVNNVYSLHVYAALALSIKHFTAMTQIIRKFQPIQRRYQLKNTLRVGDIVITVGTYYSELDDDDDVIAIGPQAVNGAPQSIVAGQTRNRPRRIGFDIGDNVGVPLLSLNMDRTTRGESVLALSLFLVAR
jgi:hypothetical protein